MLVRQACAAETETATQVAAVRPDLLPAWGEQLAAASAAVLARLWAALVREPVPGIHTRRHSATQVWVRMLDGRVALGPAAAAAPFATVGARLAIQVDGRHIDHPGQLLRQLRLPAPGAARFAAELDNSVANLALARAAAAPPPTLRQLQAMAPHLALVAAEQSVVDGHPLHPGCRCRAGLTCAQVLAYAPEHRRPIRLRLWQVPPARWLSTGTGLAPLLPVHPAQESVADAHGLTPTAAALPAWPLMSLRTVAVARAPHRHVKTALGAQLTSAVRLVSPAAVHNGPPVSTLLHRLTERVPGLRVWPEEAAGAVLVDGRPSAHLAVAHRRVDIAAGELVLPLAALAARSPRGDRTLAGQIARAGYRGDPQALLADLAGAVLAPTLGLLAAGVALEAHGQNTMLVLQWGRVCAIRYRDTGGIRISPRRLADAGIAAPPLHGDLACDDPVELRTKVSAALAVALGEIVVALAAETGVPPPSLWQAVTRSAVRLLPESGLPPREQRALLADPLPVKATTAMRLAAQPLRDQWATLPYGLGGWA